MRAAVAGFLVAASLVLAGWRLAPDHVQWAKWRLLFTPRRLSAAVAGLLLGDAVIQAAVYDEPVYAVLCLGLAVVVAVLAWRWPRGPV